VLLCRKNTGNAYDKIDGKCYEVYFVEKLLPDVCSQIVILVNHASYHGKKKEQLLKSL
jgi:hypothetical protein